MAQQLVSFSKRSPYPSIAIPGTSPSVVLNRGESVVVEDEHAKALKSALEAGVFPGLKKHITFEAVTKKKAEAADKVVLDTKINEALAEAFDTPEKIAAASDEQLLAVKGITKAGLADVRKAYPAT